MTALVTGGGGFLGQHIVRQLVARGEAVRVLARRPIPELSDLAVELARADLTDAAAVRSACRGVDVCYHVAAKPGYWGDPAAFYASNVVGTRHVLEACRAEGVSRLVFTSSPSVVIGRGDIAGGDESLPYPRRYLAHYPWTKAIAERLVLAANGPTLRTCALRPHLIWGPGDNHLIPRIVARAREGRLIGVGRGDNRVDVIHVDNAAAAHLLAADRLFDGSPVPGSVYFINQERPVSLWGFVDQILAAAGLPPVRRYVPAAVAYHVGHVLERLYRAARLPGEPRMTRFLAHQLSAHHWFSSRKAQAELGYTPKTSIEHGLEQLSRELG